jgi:hypothetical protein
VLPPLLELPIQSILYAPSTMGAFCRSTAYGSPLVADYDVVVLDGSSSFGFNVFGSDIVFNFNYRFNNASLNAPALEFPASFDKYKQSTAYANDTMRIPTYHFRDGFTYHFGLSITDPSARIPSLYVQAPVKKVTASFIKLSILPPTDVYPPSQLVVVAVASVCDSLGRAENTTLVADGGRTLLHVADSDSAPPSLLRPASPGRELLQTTVSALTSLRYEWSYLGGSDSTFVVPDTVALDTFELVIPPYTLQAENYYDFRVRVLSSDPDIPEAFAKHRFDVLRSYDIVAGISGAPQDYFLKAGDPLLLDSSRSYDPDFGLLSFRSNTNLVTFWQLPVQLTNNTKACLYTANRRIATRNSWMTYVNTLNTLALTASEAAAIFCPGEEYRIDVVKRRDGRLFYTGEGVGSIRVIALPAPLVPSTIQELTVTLVANPLYVSRYSLEHYPHDESLRLAGTVRIGTATTVYSSFLTTVLTPPDAPFESKTVEGNLLTYAWTEFNSGFADAGSPLPPAAERSDIIVRGGQMIEGQMYRFRLTVQERHPTTTALVGEGVAQITVSINRRPVVDRVEAAVSTAASGLTSVRFRCLGSADVDFPLSYTFLSSPPPLVENPFFDSSTAAALPTVQLTGAQLQPYVDVKLPVGEIDVFCVVTDKYGAKSLPSKKARIAVTALPLLTFDAASATYTATAEAETERGKECAFSFCVKCFVLMLLMLHKSH